LKTTIHDMLFVALKRCQMKATIAVLMLTLFSHTANTQEADTVLRGECIPHVPKQGPWDCGVVAPFKPYCDGGLLRGFDEIWDIVDNEQEAIALLRSKYTEMNDLHKYEQWLVCQGLIVSYSVNEPSTLTPKGSIGIHASYYLSQKPPFPLPWYQVFSPWSGNFTVNINNFGSIIDVRHGYTTE
jgi:hypothetical protein